jgi:intein-encoded DNA endonuclease-like protein
MSAVGVGIISKRGERRRCLPLEIRIKAYDDVIELRRQGLKYKEIQRKIFEKYGKQMPIPTIGFWVNGKQHPLRKLNKFDGKPSPELAYIIGTILSDGCRNFDNDKKYSLILSVKDKEFAEEFGKCLAKVLGKNKPYKPYWNESSKQWVVVGRSFLLYKFLNKPLEELKLFIEHSKDCVGAFLQAMFDGDGSIHKYRRILKLHNTNKELLSYVQYLLRKYFNINATGPHLEIRKNTIRRFPNGKISKTSEDCCCLYLCTDSLLNFYKGINFTIKRKQQRLIKAIK